MNQEAVEKDEYVQQANALLCAQAPLPAMLRTSLLPGGRRLFGFYGWELKDQLTKLEQLESPAADRQAIEAHLLAPLRARAGWAEKQVTTTPRFMGAIRAVEAAGNEPRGSAEDATWCEGYGLESYEVRRAGEFKDLFGMSYWELVEDGVDVEAYRRRHIDEALDRKSPARVAFREHNRVVMIALVAVAAVTWLCTVVPRSIFHAHPPSPEIAIVSWSVVTAVALVFVVKSRLRLRQARNSDPNWK